MTQIKSKVNYRTIETNIMLPVNLMRILENARNMKLHRGSLNERKALDFSQILEMDEGLRI